MYKIKTDISNSLWLQRIKYRENMTIHIHAPSGIPNTDPRVVITADIVVHGDSLHIPFGYKVTTIL